MTTEAHDRWLLRIALIGLALVVLSVVIGSIILTFYGRNLPGEVTGLGGTALGALAAFFVSTRPSPVAPPDQPVPVNGENPPGDPALAKPTP